MARLSLLLVLALCAVAAVKAGDEEKLFKKYGMMKIFQSCFGDELNKEYHRKMKEAAMRCKSMSMDGGSSFSSIRQTFANNPQNSPMVLQDFDWSAIQKLLQNPNNAGGQVIPIPIVINSRNKRDHHMKYFNAEYVRKLSMKMRAKMSNMTCIMRDLGYLDNNDNLNTKYMISETRNMNIDSELKQDLIEIVNDCGEFVRCLQTSGSSKPMSPMTPAIMRIKMFHKCSTKKKIMACIKKDLRMKRDMFDLSGFDGMMSEADDDEKMLAIVWAKSAFGGDDYGF